MKILSRVLMPSVVVVLLLVNVLLQRENRRLVLKTETLEAANVPMTGTPVLMLKGADLAGNPVQFDFAKQKGASLILLFSSRCKFTRLNWPNWKDVLEK